MRLTYFSGPGRAEPVRIALALSGQTWEDHRVDGPTYRALRDDGTLPWGLMPVLETEHGVIGETRAILRYVGTLGGTYVGDAWTRARIDEMVDMAAELNRSMSPSFSMEDEERHAFRHALVAPDGALTKEFQKLEGHLATLQASGQTWLAPTDDVSIADLALFTALTQLTKGWYDGFPTGMYEAYPALREFHRRVATHPKVADYYAGQTDDDTRAGFRPGGLD